MRKKILITGSSGKLGEAVTKTIFTESDHQLVLLSSDLSFNPPDDNIIYHKCNVLDFQKVKKIAYDEKPDYIINCAAVNDPLFCEKNRKLCSDVNVMTYDNLLSISRVIDCNIIMPSCDYIFSGKYGPYSEDKHPDPVNYLGKSKHAAENNCRAGSTKVAIIRTSSLYGSSSYNKGGFINETIRMLEKGKKVHLPHDFYSTPTYSDDAARVILKFIDKQRYGIYNASSKEMLSRYEIAVKIAEVFGFDKDLIIKISKDEYKLKNHLPRKAGLISLRSETDLGIKFSSLQEGLSIMKFKKAKRID